MEIPIFLHGCKIKSGSGLGTRLYHIKLSAFVNQSTEERTLKILLENKSVKVLNLYDDSIGVEGTQSLVDALIHN